MRLHGLNGMFLNVETIKRNELQFSSKNKKMFSRKCDSIDADLVENLMQLRHTALPKNHLVPRRPLIEATVPSLRRITIAILTNAIFNWVLYILGIII